MVPGAPKQLQQEQQRNGTSRLAQSRVTANLQFVKKKKKKAGVPIVAQWKRI